MQTDDGIGRILAEIESQGLGKNTLFVVTSDNGCSPAADIKGLQEQGHEPSERFRGHKADIFDGGHRVPFLVRWPERVRSGTVVDELVCLTDLLATVADVAGERLPEDAGEDSVSFLPLLEGKKGGREEIVHHSINGSFAIRDRRWKLAFCGDSGGWSEPRPGKAGKAAGMVQLFDMQSDVGETKNVNADHPEEVKRLTERMESLIHEGRSTPGPRRANEVEVRLRKRG
jgi:arylsulfatase A-like enzyme